MFERLAAWLRGGSLPEERAGIFYGTGGNVDLSLPGLSDYVATGRPSAQQTAAVEIGLGLISRSFMAAEAPGIDPMTLAMMARQTLAFGNSVWRIVVNRGVPALYPVGASSRSPAAWTRPRGATRWSLRGLPETPSSGTSHLRASCIAASAPIVAPRGLACRRWPGPG